MWYGSGSCADRSDTVVIAFGSSHRTRSGSSLSEILLMYELIHLCVCVCVCALERMSESVIVNVKMLGFLGCSILCFIDYVTKGSF